MILINGNFFCRNLTGIERFAWEILKQLDLLLTNEDEIMILVPANAKIFPDFVNIKPIISHKEVKSFPIWDMCTFANAVKKYRATALNFSNTAPLGKKCGISFLHDIYAKDFPKDFSTFKDKLIRFYSIFQYKNICKNAKKILTVSNFSKNQIQKAFAVSKERVSVIPNGWEHFKNIQEDDNIFNKFPILKEKKFFFTLGSLQKRKNLKWILEYAAKHPQEHFAISGKAIGGMKITELNSLNNLSNVTFLGYVSDGEVKSLMKKCTAFVFPSYYEGFGIPPLEALSVGAKVIVSDVACLPEIYKKAAVYINPSDTDVNLSVLSDTEISTEDVSSVLNEYTYQNAAKILYNEIKADL